MSISNATGAVHIATELTLGTTGSVAEVTTGGVRALKFVHDIGANFVCGQSTVLSLEASTGATVSALSVSGNCTVGGSLVVSGTNILAALDELTQNAASTAPSAIGDVVGLSTALSGKQAVLGASSALQLDSLTCSRLKPATNQDLQLSDSAGVVQLGLSSNAATFLREVSAPSLNVTGSLLVGGSALITGPLYVNGTNIMSTIAANAGASISSTSQLSVASLTCTGDIQGRDVVATRELHVDGACVLNGSLTCGGVNVMTSLIGKQAALTTSSNLSVGTVTTI